MSLGSLQEKDIRYLKPKSKKYIYILYIKLFCFPIYFIVRKNYKKMYVPSFISASADFNNVKIKEMNIKNCLNIKY